MDEVAESVKIALKESKQKFLSDLLSHIIPAIESEGFSFGKVLDGLVSYADDNNFNTELILSLSLAALSARVS